MPAAHPSAAEMARNHRIRQKQPALRRRGTPPAGQGVTTTNPYARRDRSRRTRSPPRMFHVKHSFASERIEAARSLFRSPRRSTVVEYAHAFCEGTYRRRRTLAFRAGRRGCVPRLRTARFRMPRTVCPAAHSGSAGRRSLPRPSLLFLSIPLAHGFARGAATCRNPARRARSRQGHVRH